jgi:hypothetical protein
VCGGSKIIELFIHRSQSKLKAKAAAVINFAVSDTIYIRERGLVLMHIKAISRAIRRRGFQKIALFVCFSVGYFSPRFKRRCSHYSTQTHAAELKRQQLRVLSLATLLITIRGVGALSAPKRRDRPILYHFSEPPEHGESTCRSPNCLSLL